MAYASRGSNGTRATTAVVVALVQGAAIYALVTGLAVHFIPPKATPDTAGYQIPIAPPLPPPKDEVKPADSIPTSPATFAARPVEPLQQVRLPDFPVIKGPIGDVGEGDIRKIIEIRPDPVPTYAPRAAIPRNDPGRWVTPNDYPARDIRDGNQGVTRFELSVGTDGKVRSCRIVSSSGSPGLDAATCRLVSARARFKPATDGNGAETTGTYSNNIRWEIPND